MSKVLEEIKKTDELRKKLSVRLANERANKTIICESCGKRHKIKDLILIIETYWDGDSYSEGGKGFLCPETNVKNRILFNEFDMDWRDRGTMKGPSARFSRLYRGLFKEQQDENRESRMYSWVNNYYVDKNRKKFHIDDDIVV